MFADKDGSFAVEGLTEPHATLTVNGSADGLTRGAGGSFTYKGKLADTETAKELIFTATDKSENTSSLTVTVLRDGAYSFERVEILQNNAAIAKNSDGDKALHSPPASKVRLRRSVLRPKACRCRSTASNNWNGACSTARTCFRLTAAPVQGTGTGEAAVKVKLASGTALFDEETAARRVLPGLRIMYS